MGAGAVGGQQPVQTVVTQSDLMNKVMACESCSLQFTFFKRKKICHDCRRQFCSNCLPREPQKTRRQCQKCRIIISGNFNRQILEAWKVKDMRCFLDCHNIPTNMCREKHDLIDLLLHHYSQASIRTSDTEHERMVQQLTERMRQDNTQEVPVQPNTDLEVDRNEPAPDPVQDSPVLERVPRMRLENISQIEEIDTLTVRQLKEVLVNNFVDYKGCCEKKELTERVRRLWTEEQRNKAKVEEMRDNAEKCNRSTTSTEQDLCKICMDATIDCVLLECGHMITCTSCGKRLAECPVCRQYVVRVVHTFRS